jgi:putative transposase
MRHFAFNGHYITRMYRRKLPHWYPEGSAVFVTWRLVGTLPRNVTWAKERSADGRSFVFIDRKLDKADFGPAWLKLPPVAECVVQIIEAAETEREICTVHDYVIMSNHVHVLITPIKPLSFVTRWIKGVSARRANQILNRTGQPFWEDESFDHWVRNEIEFDRIERYIAHNPVTAGLVNEPHQWPYSNFGKVQAKGLYYKS